MNNLIEACDIHSASPEYAKRFSEDIGEWMLSVQSDALRTSLKKFSDAKVLDVGGGHGQVIPTLLSLNYKVTLLASSLLAVGMCRKYLDSKDVVLSTGSILNLPFPDRSFDITTCFRIISHTDDWKTLIANLCRVSGKAVIIDYPTYKSFNIISKLLFPLKKRIEKNTRPFITFSDDQIIREFEKNGFSLAQRNAQFFFPMAFHRALKSVVISRFIEKIASSLKLTSLFGSPIVALFLPTASNKVS